MSKESPTFPQNSPSGGNLTGIESIEDSSKTLFLSFVTPTIPLIKENTIKNGILSTPPLVLYKKCNIETTIEKRGKLGVTGKLIPPVSTKNPDPRFHSPAFRKAVRSVLTYLGYEPTFGNFKLHDRKYGATMPFVWYEFARQIENRGNSSTRDIEDHESGVYFVTHTGAEIEMGKCLNSINKLTEFNRR